MEGGPQKLDDIEEKMITFPHLCQRRKAYFKG
jgi:hypothetical protein